MGEKKINLRKFRKICGKYREEMWEIKKINLGEFSSNLCQGLTKTMLTGTPGFQPPEQLRSESIGLTSDIYALGAVLLVLFSEKPVWPKLSPYQIMFKVTVSEIQQSFHHNFRRYVEHASGMLLYDQRHTGYCKGYCTLCVKCTVIITKKISIIVILIIYILSFMMVFFCTHNNILYCIFAPFPKAIIIFNIIIITIQILFPLH